MTTETMKQPKTSDTSKPIIYSKNNCGPCNMLKLWFVENDIEHEERNISTSEIHLKELQNLGFQSVPIVLVDGKVAANGFEPWKLGYLQ